jgi:hypothetical protein
LPQGTTNYVNNISETVDSLITPFDPGGVPNGNYGVLRDWQNANNSNYNALQLALRKQMSHGMLFNANYTWSHSIDNGSSWHDAATTAAGAAAGDGYSTDNNNTGIDRGNSIFDVRHRLSLNYVYNLPGQNLHGPAGMALGGWSLNGIWSFQSGAHWSLIAATRELILLRSITPPIHARRLTSPITARTSVASGRWTLSPRALTDRIAARLISHRVARHGKMAGPASAARQASTPERHRSITLRRDFQLCLPRAWLALEPWVATPSLAQGNGMQI